MIAAAWRDVGRASGLRRVLHLPGSAPRIYPISSKSAHTMHSLCPHDAAQPGGADSVRADATGNTTLDDEPAGGGDVRRRFHGGCACPSDRPEGALVRAVLSVRHGRAGRQSVGLARRARAGDAAGGFHRLPDRDCRHFACPVALLWSQTDVESGGGNRLGRVYLSSVEPWCAPR